MDQALNSQKTPHTSPLRASYGMSFVSILMKNDRVIKGFYCIYMYIYCMYISISSHISIHVSIHKFWWNFHHWLHWKLSKWQLPVQPVIKISSKWRHFRFSVSLKKLCSRSALYRFFSFSSVVEFTQIYRGRFRVISSITRNWGDTFPVCFSDVIHFLFVFPMWYISCLFLWGDWRF